MRLFLTNFYMNQGQNDKAEQTLLQARDDAPTDGNVLLTLARFYYLTGKADKAEEMLEASVAGEARLGRPAARAGRLPPAHERHGRGAGRRGPRLKIDPKSESARLRRAELMVDQKGETATPSPESWAIVQASPEGEPEERDGSLHRGEVLPARQQVRRGGDELAARDRRAAQRVGARAARHRLPRAEARRSSRAASSSRRCSSTPRTCPRAASSRPSTSRPTRTRTRRARRRRRWIRTRPTCACG